MYAEIHSKNEITNPKSVGKRSWVNFKIQGNGVQVLTDPQPHIDSPAWYVEIKHAGHYSDNRPEWDEVTRTLLIQLTPEDVEAMLSALIERGLIEIGSLRTKR